MLWGCGNYKYLTFAKRGSTLDVRFWRLRSVITLKGFNTEFSTGFNIIVIYYDYYFFYLQMYFYSYNNSLWLYVWVTCMKAAHSYRLGLVTWRYQARIPVRPDIWHRGCAYTVLQTVQRPGVYSASYGTVHYKDPLKSFEIRRRHSPGFRLPSVAIMPWYFMLIVFSVSCISKHVGYTKYIHKTRTAQPNQDHVEHGGDFLSQG